MSKKGILFTMVSLLIAGFFIIIFSAQLELPIDVGTETVSFRVTFLDRYKTSWEEFIGNALRAATYRALAGLSQDVSSNGLFLSSQVLNSNFEECMLNGTTRNSTKNCEGVGDQQFTFRELLDNIVQIGLSNLSINTTYTVTNLTLSQAFPFHVFTTVNISYTIHDRFAAISKNISLTELVSIEGIKDPLASSVLTYENARPIKETRIKESGWNTQNFSEFVASKEYRFVPAAPSFLMRFAVTTAASNSSCCGIEGVLSERALPAGDGIGYLDNRSYVDYLYFRDLSSPGFDCDEIFTVNHANLTNFVFVNQEKLASYNVSSSDWLTAPC